MKRRTCTLTAIAGLMFAVTLGVVLTPGTATAGGPLVDTLLGIDQPDSCHVIDLLVHNRARRFAGHGSPLGIDVLGGQPGDLELVGVNLISDGAVGCGPVFQVSFRNNSRWAVRNFRISVVGVLERIAPHSPCRSIRIPCIAIGETKCVEVQLPARCMTMGPRGGPLTPFNTLVVALDSLDELVECNELNNVAIINRAEIAVAAAAVPATTVAPSTTNPGSALPDSGSAPAANNGNVAAPTPGDEVKPSPVENIDLDKLDLDDAQETAVHIALRR